MPPLATDLQAPIDPTGYTVITGAELLQLVAGAYPQTDKGFAILTTDIAGVPEVPDAATTTKWKRYLWIRQSVSSVGLYVWNDNGATDVTYLKWQSTNIAGIGAGSIVNSMIADNTIQSVKIVSLDYSKLTGAPSGLAPSGPAGGSLAGTYPNPSIGALAVVAGNIAADAVTTVKILDLNVTIGKMAPASGSAKDMARVNAGATGMEAFTPPILFTGGIVVPAANSLKIPQVNLGATDFQMVAPTTLGRILQVVASTSTANTSSAGAFSSAALPTTGGGANLAALDTTITPINTGSTLEVELGVWVTNSASGREGVIALMQDAVANALAASLVKFSNNDDLRLLVIKYRVASANLVARTFKCYYGGSAGTTYVNQLSGGAVFGGAALVSYLKVTEYL